MLICTFICEVIRHFPRFLIIVKWTHAFLLWLSVILEVTDRIRTSRMEPRLVLLSGKTDERIFKCFLPLWTLPSPLTDEVIPSRFYTCFKREDICMLFPLCSFWQLYKNCKKKRCQKQKNVRALFCSTSFEYLTSQKKCSSSVSENSINQSSILEQEQILNTNFSKLRTIDIEVTCVILSNQTKSNCQNCKQIQSHG